MSESNKKTEPSKKDKHVVCGGEPLVKYLSSFNIPPYRFGFYFFIIISFTLSLSGAFCRARSNQMEFVTFFVNISWSFSILFIYPFVIGLSKKYYQKIQSLLNELTSVPVEGREKQATEFIKKLNFLFNNYYSPVVFLLITVLLNIKYYIQILNKEPYQNWITSGEFLKNLLNTSSGFTYPGFYSAIIQIFLIYWIFNLVWNSFVYSWGLYQIFNKNIFCTITKPLHSDGCCGLIEIGRTSMVFNYILFLLGLYVSLKVIDKIVIQSLPLNNDISNPIFLLCYSILAPVLFFLPLSAAHNKMKTAKRNLIKPFKDKYAVLVERVEEKGSNQIYENVNNLKTLINDLERTITVWPFNFKSIQSFLEIIIIPILPILLPFLVKGIVNFFQYLQHV